MNLSIKNLSFFLLIVLFGIRCTTNLNEDQPIDFNNQNIEDIWRFERSYSAERPSLNSTKIHMLDYFIILKDSNIYNNLAKDHSIQYAGIYRIKGDSIYFDLDYEYSHEKNIAHKFNIVDDTLMLTQFVYGVSYTDFYSRQSNEDFQK